METLGKLIIIGLAAALIIVSTSFAIYVTFSTTQLSRSTGNFTSDNIYQEKNSIRSFDSPQVRVDILIPSTSNDGTTIEDKKLDEIRTELATHFGGVTVLPHFNGTSIRNDTRYDGTNNSGFYVVVPNTVENLEWFANYKQILKDRLQQDRIFMTFSPIMIAP